MDCLNAIKGYVAAQTSFGAALADKAFARFAIHDARAATGAQAQSLSDTYEKASAGAEGALGALNKTIGDAHGACSAATLASAFADPNSEAFFRHGVSLARAKAHYVGARPMPDEQAFAAKATALRGKIDAIPAGASSEEQERQLQQIFGAPPKDSSMSLAIER